MIEGIVVKSMELLWIKGLESFGCWTGSTYVPFSVLGYYVLMDLTVFNERALYHT